ncbi:hypothetical protein PF005_g3725 [Phytophthora fragariae]|uniref:Uncharacterized protein n=1 Tax=Phytophthora fragariae TaxID=53985 RepID=A0A6A3Z431_9STRA|nr:hypothetical protein PF006_g2949 [Phytophthora fragariae]KAE9229793.1 hypothetical protein PF005_g3725 [Phytophthora fragariae]
MNVWFPYLQHQQRALHQRRDVHEGREVYQQRVAHEQRDKQCAPDGERAYIRADDANNLRVRKAVFQTPLLPIPALVLQSNSLIPAASPNKWVASSFVFPAPVFTISALKLVAS